MRIGLMLAAISGCSGDHRASKKPPPPPAQVVAVPDLELRVDVPANPKLESVRDNDVTVTTSACTVMLRTYGRASFASKAEEAWNDGYAAAKVAPTGARYTIDDRAGRTWNVEWTSAAGWGIRDRVALADGRLVDCGGDCPTDVCAACVAHACETLAPIE